MVEFSDLFDNEDDVFQKKAKVCTQLTHSHPPSPLEQILQENLIDYLSPSFHHNCDLGSRSHSDHFAKRKAMRK